MAERALYSLAGFALGIWFALAHGIHRVSAARAAHITRSAITGISPGALVRPEGGSMSAIPSMSSPEVAEQVRALTGRLSPTAARLQYLADLLKPMLAVGEPEDRNAFYAAGRLIGSTPAFARTVVAAIARHGSADAWLKFRRRPPAMPVLNLPPIAPNLVGFVYFANPVTAPDVVRIGLSTNLERRMRDLQVETGEEHRVAHWFVGTTVDEAVAQFTFAGRRITGKWFATSDNGQIPGFLPIGLNAMQQMLGEGKGRAA